MLLHGWQKALKLRKTSENISYTKTMSSGQIIYRLHLWLHVAGLGLNPSPGVRVDLNKRCAQLQTRVNDFINQAIKFIPEHLIAGMAEGPDVLPGDSEFLALLEGVPDIPAPFVLLILVAENR